MEKFSAIHWKSTLPTLVEGLHHVALATEYLDHLRKAPKGWSGLNFDRVYVAALCDALAVKWGSGPTAPDAMSLPIVGQWNPALVAKLLSLRNWTENTGALLINEPASVGSLHLGCPLAQEAPEKRRFNLLLCHSSGPRLQHQVLPDLRPPSLDHPPDQWPEDPRV